MMRESKILELSKQIVHFYEDHFPYDTKDAVDDIELEIDFLNDYLYDCEHFKSFTDLFFNDIIKSLMIEDNTLEMENDAVDLYKNLFNAYNELFPHNNDLIIGDKAVILFQAYMKGYFNKLSVNNSELIDVCVSILSFNKEDYLEISYQLSQFSEMQLDQLMQFYREVEVDLEDGNNLSSTYFINKSDWTTVEWLFLRDVKTYLNDLNIDIPQLNEDFER